VEVDFNPAYVYQITAVEGPSLTRQLRDPIKSTHCDPIKSAQPYSLLKLGAGGLRRNALTSAALLRWNTGKGHKMWAMWRQHRGRFLRIEEEANTLLRQLGDLAHLEALQRDGVGCGTAAAGRVRARVRFATWTSMAMS
jgi:hypothetical protein